MRTEVCIVGAGTAGCATATALCQRQIKTIMIDRKTKEDIGKKVCGDAIAQSHLDRTERDIGFGSPKGDEAKQYIRGMDIYSPDGSARIRLEAYEESGHIVDRYLFGQRILKLALDTGAELLDESKVNDLFYSDGNVSGVKIRKKDGTTEEIQAKIVIDASGSSAILRKKLPEEIGWFIEKKISSLDMGYAYREIRTTKKEIEEPEFLQLYFSQDIASGGYVWVFPRGSYGVNVGVGGARVTNIDVVQALSKFISEKSLFKGSEIVHAGAGLVPIRRPLNSFVANNFALVGDTASQVNPLHGGGIGPGMEGGTILAKTIEKALEKEDTSTNSLWSYNVEYQRSVGVRHSALDVFRLLIMDMRDRDFAVGIKRRLISSEDVMDVGVDGHMKMSMSRKLSKLVKGITAPRVLRKLITASRRMKAIQEIYRDYPDRPENLPAWLKRVKSTYKGVAPSQYRV